MRHYILNVKSLMFLFAIVLLTYGAQGISYGAVCKAGDILSPGESCTYPGTNAVFSVLNNGQSQWNIPGLPWWLAWVNKISLDELSVSDLTVNGVRYDFAASKQADGTWFIETVGHNSTPPPVSNPDLVVGQPTVSQSTLAPGGSFTLSATAANNGAGSAAATTLRYYRSTNATITTSDTEVGTDSVSALGANQSSAESITLTAPSSPGTYYYGACVEAVTGESSSDNNCSTAVSITVQQSTEPPGQTTYSVGEDIPTLPTGSWYPDTVLGSGGGASVVISGGKTTITFGNGGAIREDGITYTCVAAGGCTVEGRRVTGGTIQTSGGEQTPPSAQQPDLVVQQPTVSQSTLAPGENFTLSATVANNGAGSAAATTLRYYRSTNATITTRDTEVGKDSVGALGANQSSAESITLTAPSSPGTYYYGACVEAVTGESSSNNNCSAAVSITVQQQSQQPGTGGGTATLSASTAAPLTEATLNESVITLTLSSGTWQRSEINIGNALTVSGISDVTIGTFGPAWFGVDRISDTQITVELGFTGNIDTNSTLTFTVSADAIADYDGAALIAQIPVTASTESLVASTVSPLTEATLNESVVILTLSGRTYERSSYTVGRALTVSGIDGVTFRSYDVDRVSDTEVTVELGFDGNIDTNGTLIFTLGADAIVDYGGAALTAQIPVTASTESLVASTVSPLTEATLNESVVTLTISGRAYERSSYTVGRALTVSGIDGVTFKSYNVDRVSDTEVTVELEFNGNIDTDSMLTFTVGAGAIPNYDGPSLTAQIPVAAATEWVVASTALPLTKATLDGSVVILTLNGSGYERWSSDIRSAVTVSGIAGVTIDAFGVERVSDAEIAVELEFDSTIDPNGTLTFTVAAGAIANYDGPAVTAQLAVPTQLEAGEAGDVNGDGAVSIQDLMLVASSFGQTGQHPADVNGDGTVNIKDLIVVAGVLDTAAAAPSLYPHSLEGLTALDVHGWLSQAQPLNLTDATSQRGIMFLENLLMVLSPKETMLLPNFPNPFNPETWIPYHLANDTDVSLCIYDMDGALVRELDLGHQRAGYYTDRSRAAYWDGPTHGVSGLPVVSISTSCVQAIIRKCGRWSS